MSCESRTIEIHYVIQTDDEKARRLEANMKLRIALVLAGPKYAEGLFYPTGGYYETVGTLPEVTEEMTR